MDTFDVVAVEQLLIVDLFLPLLDALDVLLFLLAAHELRKYTAVAVVLLGLFGTAS